MFRNVIVKRPCKAMVNGITFTPKPNKPDYELAVKQHNNYISALKACGVNITILEADEKYPDSCFIEDVAVLTKNVAIVTNPGTPVRNGEKEVMVELLKKFYPPTKIKYIRAPGTIDGGDVMKIGNHFYVGLSERTNEEGFRQFTKIINEYGYTASSVPLKKVIHLKAGLSFLENNNLLISGEFINKKEFKDFNKIIIDDDESPAANCIWVNGTVMLPTGYPKTYKAIRGAGYKVNCIDISEFQKLDGGLSCLSLRF